MATPDPDQQRATMRESWEGAAAGWGSHAERVRAWGMPVSVAMIDALHLQPGQRVLELAAGPGDTGFLAAEIIAPGGGSLLSSDGAEAMIEVARARAAELGVTNVEFKQLELEWIDLPTASVDAVLCRWGIMLTVDPEAAAQEIRRVLRAGGRAAFSVWDTPERNPWATIFNGALVDLSFAQPPDPAAPGPFALAAPGRLQELLEAAGFTDLEVSAVPVVRHFATFEEYLAEMAETSPSVGSVWRRIDADERAEISARLVADLVPYTAEDGSVSVPGRCLVAAAEA
ncbi:MAG TPA: methyltransferase domain-containing protein [Solirubrobacteraceae bacterium]|nr:methyltransferase domain-containing protein [Solirubrobacteraceae bacterium]